MNQQNADRLSIGIAMSSFGAQLIFLGAQTGPPTVWNVIGLVVSVSMVPPPLRRRWVCFRFLREAGAIGQELERVKGQATAGRLAVLQLQTRIDRAKEVLEIAEREGGSAEDALALALELEAMEALAVRSTDEAERNLAVVARRHAALEAHLTRVVAVLQPRPRSMRDRVSSWLVSVAAHLGGPSSQHLIEAWHADLAGMPESGYSLSPGRRFMYAGGLVWAAIKLRLSGVMRPVDWILATQQRADVLTAVVVGAVVLYLGRDLHGMLVDALSTSLIVFAGMRSGIAWLRRVRGIELASGAPAATSNGSTEDPS
ncbi:hypothetical protein ACFWBC_39285 [Streptomyces sp. NPDC059985]|uniref:hypothetical protein n=1 Tax=Streptomyces sp. NPDC059985 TaxID=3347025 RepID=UPI0036C696D3